MEPTLLQRLAEMLRAGATDFGGIAAFYALLWTLGLKAAIAGTIVFVAVDAVRRHYGGLGFSRLYLLSSAMVIGFGAIDLLSKTPFMIKYEAVITSLVLAAIFLAGARGRSLIEDVVSRQHGESFDDRPDMRRFFQLLTLFWAGYFLVKAAAYAWIGATMPIERAMDVRGIVGMASLALMMALSMQGRWLFALCRSLGLLPVVQASEA